MGFAEPIKTHFVCSILSPCRALPHSMDCYGLYRYLQNRSEIQEEFRHLHKTRGPFIDSVLLLTAKLFGPILSRS